MDEGAAFTQLPVGTSSQPTASKSASGMQRVVLRRKKDKRKKRKRKRKRKKKSQKRRETAGRREGMTYIFF